MPRVLVTTAVILLVLVTTAASRQARQSRIVVPVGTFVVSQQGASTILKLESNGRTQRLALPDDDDMVAAGSFQEAELLGSLGDAVVVLSTTYSSQNGRGGPGAQCAAGQETVLRVVVLSPLPRQTYQMLVESCWKGVYGMPVTWNPADTSFTLDSGEDCAEGSKCRYIVDRNGGVRKTVTR